MPATHPATTEAEYQGMTFEWTVESGKIESLKFKGTSEQIHAKASHIATTWQLNGKQVLTMRGNAFNGRGDLEINFATDLNYTGVSPNSEGSIEELYGIDIIKDIRTAPMFETLSADNMNTVWEAVEKRAKLDETWASTDPLMPKLFNYGSHGHESYFETAFVYRQSRYRATSEHVGISFANINRVVQGNDVPVLSQRMRKLFEALPAGEWLKKPPQAAYTGQSKYHLTQEWHWAVKWLEVYGGSLTYEPEEP